MTKVRARILILVSGTLIATASPSLCHAQESGTLLDVKIPQTEVSPVFVPEIINAPLSPTQVKPAREVSEQSWYWRFLGMIAISAAEYNTVKQSDGRPGPRGNFR